MSLLSAWSISLDSTFKCILQLLWRFCNEANPRTFFRKNFLEIPVPMISSRIWDLSTLSLPICVDPEWIPDLIGSMIWILFQHIVRFRIWIHNSGFPCLSYLIFLMRVIFFKNIFWEIFFLYSMRVIDLVFFVCLDTTGTTRLWRRSR